MGSQALQGNGLAARRIKSDGRTAQRMEAMSAQLALPGPEGHGTFDATRGAGAEREKKKRTPYIRSETGEKQKARRLSKKGPAVGPWVGLGPTWV
jgi:hypothetical protein